MFRVSVYLWAALNTCMLVGCTTVTKKQQSDQVKSEQELETSCSIHASWDELLSKNVDDNGSVNYLGFKSDSLLLQSYLSKLSDNYPTPSWSNNEKLAYWINVYNAFTVKLIIDNYPVKSIKDIGSVLYGPWDQRIVQLKEYSFTLNHIEHNILRKEFAEPRIHFAIVCASISCPELLNKAYTGHNVREQLDQRAKLFINDTTKNLVASKQITISKIFKWFEGDFTTNGTVIDYLNLHCAQKINNSAEIVYFDYNWGLNE